MPSIPSSMHNLVLKRKLLSIIALFSLFHCCIGDNNDFTLDIESSFKISDCTKQNLQISVSLQYREQSQGPATNTECVSDSASNTYEFDSKSYSCDGQVQFNRGAALTFYDKGNGTLVPGIFNFTSVNDNGTVNIYVRNGDFTGVCDLVLTQGACTWCFGETECQASVCTYGITVRVFEPFWGSTLGIVTIACIVGGCVCLSVALSICCYCCLCKKDDDEVHSNKKKKSQKKSPSSKSKSKSSAKLTASEPDEKGTNSIDMETKSDGGQYSPIPIQSPNKVNSTKQQQQSSSISKATSPTFINKDYTDMPSKDYLDAKHTQTQSNKNTINNRAPTTATTNNILLSPNSPNNKNTLNNNNNKNTINNRNISNPEGYSNVPQVMAMSGKQNWEDLNSNVVSSTEYADMLPNTDPNSAYPSSSMQQPPSNDQYGSMPNPVQSETYGTMPSSSHSSSIVNYTNESQYGAMPNAPPPSQSSQYGAMPTPSSNVNQASQYGAMPSPSISSPNPEYGQMPFVPNRH